MNPSNKKGFTIVELVIVIAVIAILSAVLIPTFSGIIKKANQAADIQAARQMDVALQAESAIEKPADIGAVVDILADAGYAAEESLKPITTDHTFYWHKTYNAIVLANEEDDDNPVVLYPAENEELVNSFAADKALTGDNMVLYDLSESYKYVVVKADTAQKLADALSKGQKVELTQDITLDANNITLPEGSYTPDSSNQEVGVINIAPDSDVTMDLNGKKLTINNANTSFVVSYGNFTLEGNGGQLIVNGSGYGAALTNVDYGTMTVKDITITVNVDTTACAIYNNLGDLIMEDTTINAKRGCLNAQGGTVTATDCTFTSEIGRVPLYSTYAHVINVDDYGELMLSGEITVNITAPAEQAIVASIVMVNGAYPGQAPKYGTISNVGEYTFKTSTASNFKGTNSDNYMYYQ